MTDNYNEEVVAYEADRTLRELIGETVRLAEVFTHERITAGQQEINNSRAMFQDKAEANLTELDMLMSYDPQLVDDVLFEDISLSVSNIRGLAKLFGFNLVSTISEHVIEHCEPGQHSPVARYLIIRELIKLLRFAVRERLTDENGTIARNLKYGLTG